VCRWSRATRGWFNQYGVTLVNPARFPHVKARDGQAFIDWLISPEGQQAIAGYRIDASKCSIQRRRRVIPGRLDPCDCWPFSC